MVVKRDGRREVFDPEKLEKKVRIALEKRPVSQARIEELVTKVEDDASYKAKASHEIDSQEIGEMVLRGLYEIDRVGYVRFASVYRMFENVDEFIREIERLSK